MAGNLRRAVDFTRSIGRLAIVAAAQGCALLQPPLVAVPPQPVEGQTLLLTPTAPRAMGQGVLRAYGYGSFNCNVISIDTRAFRSAGTLTVEVQLGTGESAASFSLFPGGAIVQPPAERPQHIEWAQDVSPGWKGELQASLSSSGGQMFKLCAEGNWFSRVSATNTYSIVASVRR